MKVFLFFLAGILLNLGSIAQDHISNREIVLAIAPIYPSRACFGKFSGSVKLEVTINHDGDVVDTKVINAESVIDKMFDSVSEHAAKRWKFVSTPSQMRERKYIITFIFRLMRYDTDLEDITTIYRAPFEMEIRCRMNKPVILYSPNTSIGEEEEEPTNVH